MINAACQTTIYAYNGRGQLLTEINARGETKTYTYDTNGYPTYVNADPLGY